MLLWQCVDWLELFMAQSQPQCLFPIYRPRVVYKHQFFGAQTLNGQLEDREEQFAKFDKKCTGLESRTAPLSRLATLRRNCRSSPQIQEINNLANTVSPDIYETQ